MATLAAEFCARHCSGAAVGTRAAGLLGGWGWVGRSGLRALAARASRRGLRARLRTDRVGRGSGHLARVGFRFSRAVKERTRHYDRAANEQQENEYPHLASMLQQEFADRPGDAVFVVRWRDVQRLAPNLVR
jgi:hypothetical protein